jgi:glutathione S-transferase
MAVTLHRCRYEWLKSGPCWRVEKALREVGIEYTLAPGPSRPSKRDAMLEHTGQRLYPAIELEDGTWYREESKDMARRIRDGRLGLS